MSYQESLKPWGVYRLDQSGEWVKITSYRNRVDAENYARIFKNSTKNPAIVCHATESELKSGCTK